MIYCGIDNGVTGSIGIVNNFTSLFLKTPTKTVTNYQKTAKKTQRIDYPELKNLFLNGPFEKDCMKVFIERPMVNPGRFLSTASALRALEATLICLEELEISHQFIDSKQWQKDMLPSGIKGAAELKKASKDIGIRLFPQFKVLIEKQGDSDGILIAEWARRSSL